MRPLDRVRAICTSFPGVSEREGETNSFQVRGRNFVVYWHNWFRDPRPAVWCKAPDGAQHEMVSADPDLFFVPAWMGRHGWIGIRMEPVPQDWDELAAMFETAYRMTAPKKLWSQLDG